MAKDKEAPLSSWEDFDDDVLNKEEEEVITPITEEEGEEAPVVPEKKVVKPIVVKKAKVETPVLEEEEVVEPVKIPDATETPEENQDPDYQKFFEEVQKITGEEFDVDYGDVDPMTPQGVALREKAVKQAALDGFLEEIETKYPIAYRALEHAYAGGNVADLFKAVTTRDYSQVQLADDDTATAKEILKEYYQGKGIKNPDRLEKLIALAEDSAEGLVTEAKGALDELRVAQQEEANKILASQKAQAETQKRQDSLMVGALDEILESGKLDTFKIGGPRETAEFREFIKKGLRRAGEGQYEFATPIDSKNLEKILKYKFFEFKNGDLSKLIQVKATTENAQKLRLRLAGEVAKPKAVAGAGAQSSFSLTDFDEE